MRLSAVSRRAMLCGVAAVLLLAPVAGAQDAAGPVHPNELPRLDLQTTYPRMTADELARSGYPDHMHAYTWPGWRPMLDSTGGSYGPGTLCAGSAPASLPGLVVETGHIAWECFDAQFADGYEPCDLVSFVEWCDVGRIMCRDLLELEPDGILNIINPSNTREYRTYTGFGTWRLYQLRGDVAIMQPIPTLMGRTLEGHAAVELAVDWILGETLGDEVPPWLRVGLAGYFAESGIHLNNYMAEFRVQMEQVLMGPAEIDAILAADADPDDTSDRRQFRRASYSAFVMAWHLVENRGGMEKLRAMLHAVRDGDSLATAATKVYGTELTELVAGLDPLVSGEPIGSSTGERRPHVPPVK